MNLHRFLEDPNFDQVVAMDWMGMGGSSRTSSDIPQRSILARCVSSEAPSIATDFFIDTLEECREQLGLRDFVLAGHSLGEGDRGGSTVSSCPSLPSFLIPDSLTASLYPLTSPSRLCPLFCGGPCVMCHVSCVCRSIPCKQAATW